MMWDWMGGTGGAGWLWMLGWWVFVLVLLAVAVLAAVWLARNLGGDRSDPTGVTGGEAGPSASARETLDLRYARGELSRDEYRQARRDLETPTA